MSQPSDRPPEPPPPMPARRRRDREVWVGLFAITAVLLVVAALFTLTDASMFRGRYLVTTRVDDAAGIRRGDPVQLRGVNIGRVRGFSIVPSGVVIQLEIEGEYRVPRDSRVRLGSAGLLGGRVAEVLPGESTEVLSGGEQLPGVKQVGLTGEADGLAEASLEVLERMQALLSEETVEGIEASSVELSQLLKSLSAGVAEQRASLSALSAALGRSAENVERATGPELMRSVARVDALTKQMEALPPRIEGVLASLDRSSNGMEAVVGRLNRGEGTLGRLSREDALYLNANQAVIGIGRAARQVGLLSEDIRRNPRKYVRLSLF